MNCKAKPEVLVERYDLDGSHDTSIHAVQYRSGGYSVWCHDETPSKVELIDKSGDIITFKSQADIDAAIAVLKAAKSKLK